PRVPRALSRCGVLLRSARAEHGHVHEQRQLRAHPEGKVPVNAGTSRGAVRRGPVLVIAAALAVGCSFITSLDELTSGGRTIDPDAGRGDAPSGEASIAPGDDAATGDSGTSYRAVVLADQPVAYWRLGEASGALHARDETGHGHDGTYA